MKDIREMPKEVDYTMLSTFLVCRKKYYWRMIRHLVGKAPMTAAEFGRAIHSALDIWYATHDIASAINTFKSEFTENPGDSKRTHAVGTKLLQLYATKYEHESFKVLKTELSFTVDIPNTDIKLMGRIDKIIDWDGVVYVLDHKTTSRLGYEFFYKIKPNMQFDGYVYAAKKLGYDCKGIVLDALLVAKGLIVPSQLSRLTPLARDISIRSEHDINRYLSNIESILTDMNNCYNSNLWYENTESCCNFIQCPYRSICKENTDIHERIIAMDYIEEPWSPHREVKDGKV